MKKIDLLKWIRNFQKYIQQKIPTYIGRMYNVYFLLVNEDLGDSICCFSSFFIFLLPLVESFSAFNETLPSFSSDLQVFSPDLGLLCSFSFSVFLFCFLFSFYLFDSFIENALSKSLVVFVLLVLGSQSFVVLECFSPSFNLDLFLFASTAFLALF